jgi:hypothetical protein
MGRYVEIPADAIRVRMADAGFRRISHNGSEEVYERRHHIDPRYAVKVYSSVTSGTKSARGCGEDAIRVVAIFYHKPSEAKAIMDSIKVLRTAPEKMSPQKRIEHVLDRMIERAREAYRVCNSKVKEQNNG